MSEIFSVMLVKVPVSDVAKAATFYCEVLGLESEFVAAEYGWAQLKTGNLPIALYEPGKGGGAGVAGNCDSLHLSVSNLELLRQRLSDNQIDPDTIQHKGNDGTVYLELNDPDGNTLKVFLQQGD